MIRSSTRFVPLGRAQGGLRRSAGRLHRRRRSGAAAALDAFEAQWGAELPERSARLARRLGRVRPFFDFPAEIRRLIYTTNAIESLNRQLRKVIKTKGHFPSDDAALKLLYLALRNAEKTWGHRDRVHWQQARLQFAIHFDGRLPDAK